MSFTVSEVLTLALPALAVVLAIYGLVYASSHRRIKRYRPGRPFQFMPVWFLASPERLAGKTGAAALEGRPQQQQLPGRLAGEPAVGPVLAAQTEGAQHVGGASDRW